MQFKRDTETGFYNATNEEGEGFRIAKIGSNQWRAIRFPWHSPLNGSEEGIFPTKTQAEQYLNRFHD